MFTSPLSQEKIITTGIISKVQERILISDININPGNSGGPLFNNAGQVVARIVSKVFLGLLRVLSQIF